MFDIGLGNLVVEHILAIESNRHGTVLTDNFLGVPDVIGDGRLRQDDGVLFIVGRGRFRAPGEIEYSIQAACATPIGMAVIYLAFDSKPGEA